MIEGVMISQQMRIIKQDAERGGQQTFVRVYHASALRTLQTHTHSDVDWIFVQTMESHYF